MRWTRSRRITTMATRTVPYWRCLTLNRIAVSTTTIWTWTMTFRRFSLLLLPIVCKLFLVPYSTVWRWLTWRGILRRRKRRLHADTLFLKKKMNMTLARMVSWSLRLLPLSLLLKNIRAKVVCVSLRSRLTRFSARWLISLRRARMVKCLLQARALSLLMLKRYWASLCLVAINIKAINMRAW